MIPEPAPDPRSARLVSMNVNGISNKREHLQYWCNEERVDILKEAKEEKESIIKEAKEKAKEAAQKIVVAAKADIEHMKLEVMTNVKNEVGAMAISIAEKLLLSELQDKGNKESLAQKLVDGFKLN